MKTYYLILALVCFFLAGYAVHAAGPATNVVTLVWDYPTNQMTPDLVFKLYSTTNAAAPLPWAFFGQTSGTVTNLTFQIEKEQRYWYCTSSNFWGESDPSNVASTPPAPRGDLNLKIKRGL